MRPTRWGVIWAGLAQRTVLAVLFPCIVVLALRLLRVTRATDAPR